MLVSGLFMMLRGFVVMVSCLFSMSLPFLQYAEETASCLIKTAQIARLRRA